MGVDGCVARGASQVLAIAVGDVLASFWVAEALGKAEVDDVDEVLLLLDPNQKIVWLDVPMQEVP